MIEVPFIIHEDGLRRKKAGEQVYEGTPLTLDLNGELKVAANTDKVYGLSKLDSNNLRDFAWGEFAAFGSGQLTVVTQGTVILNHSTYNKIEVDSSMTTASVPTVVKLYDDTKNYVPGEVLYVDGTGKVSNVSAGNKVSILGRVLKPLLAGAAGGLELELLPGIITAAADLA